MALPLSPASVNHLTSLAKKDRSRTSSVTLRLPILLSLTFSVVCLIGTAITVFNPGVLREPDPTTVGSARGTALVLLLIGLPVLWGAIVKTFAGSNRAAMVWLGTLGYALYNASVFAIGTAFMRLFPIYLAMFALCLWSLLVFVMQLHIAGIRSLVQRDLHRRSIAVYLLLSALFTIVLWSSQLVPALVDNTVPNGLDKTSMPTSLFHVMDFSIVVPLTVLTAVWLWHRQWRGYVLAGAFLVYGMLESIGVAADQWFAHVEDPSSSLAGVPIFVVLTLIGAGVLAFYLRQDELDAIPLADSSNAAA